MVKIADVTQPFRVDVSRLPHPALPNEWGGNKGKKFTKAWSYINPKEFQMSDKGIGVIGGSGLYEMEGLENVKEVKVKPPFGPPSDAYITGSLGTVKMVFLPRHGRGHR